MKDPGYDTLAILVVKAQHGDTDAFSELYALTYDKVYNYTCHYLRDMDLAQDALQDIYILALKKLHTLSDPMLFTAWLNQISFRVCYDICKSRDSGYGVIDDEILELVSDDSQFANPSREVENAAQISHLRAAIEKLPHLQRSVIILRYFNELKLNEIAETLDISLSTTKRYLASAQETLKKAMIEWEVSS